MLSSKVILYDDSCPMCSLYTQAFVRFKLLEPDHRVGLAEADPSYLKHLDLQRARHEIPLLDRDTGEVMYGIDALIFIFSHRFPPLRHIFHFKLFRSPLYALYQLVTYNRRVIAGTAAPCTGFNCAPDFNLKYRLIYLCLALGVWSGLMVCLGLKAALVQDSALSGAIVMIVCIQIIALAAALKVRNRWDYGSNTATDVLLFSLLVLPSAVVHMPLALLGANLAMATVITSLDFGRRIRNLAV
ncbi:MAG: hypothetical protein ABJA67_11540 [Chthonomonadales bacterium]